MKHKMDFTITNYNGIEAATIETSPVITIIGAANGTGKTSIARAMAAVTTGKAFPENLGLTQQKQKKLFVRDGSLKGSVVLDARFGKSMVTIPDGEYNTNGSGDVLSDVAAGALDLGSRDYRPEERAAYITEVTGAEPSMKDLAGELTKVDMPAVPVDMKNLIETAGWDAVHAKAKEDRTASTGAWRQCTGVNYGKRIAEDWCPDDWDYELEKADIAKLKEDERSAQELYEATVKTVGIDEAERAKMREAVDSIVGLQEKKDGADRNMESLKDRGKTQRAKVDVLEEKLNNIALQCPACQVALDMVDGGLVESDGVAMGAEELKTRQETIKLERSKLNSLLEAYHIAATLVHKVEVDLCFAQTCATKLEALEAEGAENDKQDNNAQEKAASALAFATARIKAFETKTNADKLKSKIDTNEALVKILAPAGLRKKSLQAGIKKLQDLMDKITEVAGWEKVTLDADCNAYYNGRIYLICSESERYRCDRVLQLACAKLEGAYLIVMDRADILLSDIRAGLMKAFTVVNIPMVICLAILEKDMPDTSKKPFRSYRVTDGTVQEIFC